MRSLLKIGNRYEDLFRLPGALSDVVGSSDVSLQSVLASCLCDLDATLTKSYSGAGTRWANAVPSGSTYDFVFGDGSTSNTYPTFTGTAGAQDAYFALDGGDYFTIENGNDSILSGLAKGPGETDVWFGAAFKAGSSLAGTNLCGTGQTTNEYWMRITIGADGRVLLRTNDGSSPIDEQEILAAGSIVAGNDYVLLVSYKLENPRNIKVGLNSSTLATVAGSFDVTTTDASNDFTIGASAGVSPLDAGTRLYHFSFGNEYLTDEKAVLIINALETRHGRSYTDSGYPTDDSGNYPTDDSGNAPTPT